MPMAAMRVSESGSCRGREALVKRGCPPLTRRQRRLLQRDPDGRSHLSWGDIPRGFGEGSEKVRRRFGEGSEKVPSSGAALARAVAAEQNLGGV